MNLNDDRLLLIHSLLLACSVVCLTLATVLFILCVWLVFGGFGA